MGGAIFRIVAESSRDSCGRFSGDILPFIVPFMPVREGILEGLFCADAARTVPARLGACEDLPTVAGLVGMPLLEGVFARGGGAAFCAAA